MPVVAVGEGVKREAVVVVIDPSVWRIQLGYLIIDYVVGVVDGVFVLVLQHVLPESLDHGIDNTWT